MLEDLAVEIQELREKIEAVFKPSRERSLTITKLDEMEMWLDKCEVREDESA